MTESENFKILCKGIRKSLLISGFLGEGEHLAHIFGWIFNILLNLKLGNLKNALS